MHPPLDRPHPDCQEAVDKLRHCHDTNSKFKFWACNELKFRLDKCFAAEKDRMLKELNKDIVERRREEEAQAAISTGKNMTFQQYLATDKEYQKDIEKIQNNKQSTWFG
jgi:COX assembly protein 2